MSVSLYDSKSRLATLACLMDGEHLHNKLDISHCIGNREFYFTSLLLSLFRAQDKKKKTPMRQEAIESLFEGN